MIAVVDTGVAFRNWGRFGSSPDFRRALRCVVAGSLRRRTKTYPLDREGHGTFVTGEIAEQTNNGFGLTGLAYEASIMPIRVLDSSGEGDSSTIAAGIRYAVDHGAQVINLSMEFSLSVSRHRHPRHPLGDQLRARAQRGRGRRGRNDDASRIAFPAGARP